jgi:hypothetical protein
MGVRGRVTVGTFALAAALSSVATVARADETEEREAFALPVVRGSLGFVSSRGTPDSGLMAQVDVGVHMHYSYAFFGGELGYAAAETEKLTSTQFFHLGAPLGVTTEEAWVGFAFVPRVLVGQRLSHDVTAFRLGGAVYALAGTFSFELAHERWIGDGGSARFVGIFGVDAGRLIFLLVDDGDLQQIR